MAERGSAAARLLARRAAAGTRTIETVDGDAPLSFGQERLWLMSQIQDGAGGGGLCNVFRLRGPLDIARLETALTELHRRHDILRTVIARRVQRVLPPAPVALPLLDLSGAPLEAAREAARELDARPYRLDLEPPIRWLLCRLGPDDHALCLVAHHIIVDGWSEHILRNDLSALLAGAPLPPLRHRYADFAAWQRARLSEADRDFWRRELAGAPPALALPFDRVPDAATDFSGGVLRDEVPGFGLAAFPATRYMVFLTAFAAMLARATGQTDLVIGAPAAGRTRPEWEALVGFFITSVPVRLDLSGHPTFRELLTRVRERCLAAMAHQDLPLEHIVADLRPRRLPGRQPLVQAMFQVYELPPTPLVVPGADVTEEQLFRATSSLDLSVSLVRSPGGGFGGYWQYRGSVFDESTVARLRAAFYDCVREMTTTPDARIL